MPVVVVEVGVIYAARVISLVWTLGIYELVASVVCEADTDAWAADS